MANNAQPANVANTNNQQINQVASANNGINSSQPNATSNKAAQAWYQNVGQTAKNSIIALKKGVIWTIALPTKGVVGAGKVLINTTVKTCNFVSRIFSCCQNKSAKKEPFQSTITSNDEHEQFLNGAQYDLQSVTSIAQQQPPVDDANGGANNNNANNANGQPVLVLQDQQQLPVGNANGGANNNNANNANGQPVLVPQGQQQPPVGNANGGVNNNNADVEQPVNFADDIAKYAQAKCIGLNLPAINKAPLMITQGPTSIASGLQVFANVPYLRRTLFTQIQNRLVERQLFGQLGAAHLGSITNGLPIKKQKALQEIAQAFQKNKYFNLSVLNKLCENLQIITEGGLDNLQGLQDEEKKEIQQLLFLLTLNKLLRAKTPITADQMSSIYKLLRASNETLNAEPFNCGPETFLRTLIQKVTQEPISTTSKVAKWEMKEKNGCDAKHFPDVITMRVSDSRKDDLPETLSVRVKMTENARTTEKTKTYQPIAVIFRKEKTSYTEVLNGKMIPSWYRCDNTVLNKEIEHEGLTTNINSLKRKHNCEPYMIIAVPKE